MNVSILVDFEALSFTNVLAGSLSGSWPICHFDLSEWSYPTIKDFFMTFFLHKLAGKIWLAEVYVYWKV